MNVSSVCFFLLLNIRVHNSKGQLPDNSPNSSTTEAFKLDKYLPDHTNAATRQLYVADLKERAETRENKRVRRKDVDKTLRGQENMYMSRVARQSNKLKKKKKKAAKKQYCENQPADVHFLLDTSASIKKENFKKQLDFVFNFSKSFTISPRYVRVGLTTYATIASNQFYMDEYTNKTDLLYAIKNVPYAKGDWTHTYLGLKFVRQNAFAATHGGRPDVPDILIVTTDGVSSNRAYTTRETKLINKTDIRRFVLAIGSDDTYNAYKDELFRIASCPPEQHVYQVSDFGALASIQSKLQLKLCRDETLTTTTEVSLTHKLPNATIATLSTPEPPNAKTEPISPPESQHTRSETSESTITVTSPSSSRKPDTTTKPKALGEVKAATSDSSRVIIIVSVIGGLCIVAAMATAYFFIKKRKKDTTSNEQKESNESLAPSETSQTSSIIEDKDKVDNGEIEGDDDEEEEDENNERRVHWDI